MGKNRNPNYGDAEKKTVRPNKPPKSQEARENWNKYNAKNEKDKVLV